MDIQKTWMLLQIIKLAAESGPQYARFAAMAQAELDEIGKEPEKPKRVIAPEPTEYKDAMAKANEAQIERRPIDE